MKLTWRVVMDSLTKLEVFFMVGQVMAIVMNLLFSQWMWALVFYVMVAYDLRYYRMRARAYIFSKIANDAVVALKKTVEVTNEVLANRT